MCLMIRVSQNNKCDQQSKRVSSYIKRKTCKNDKSFGEVLEKELEKHNK